MFLLIETQSDTSNMIPIQREDRVNKPNPQPLALTITCITILYVYIQLLILSNHTISQSSTCIEIIV